MDSGLCLLDNYYQKLSCGCSLPTVLEVSTTGDIPPMGSNALAGHLRMCSLIVEGHRRSFMAETEKLSSADKAEQRLTWNNNCQFLWRGCPAPLLVGYCGSLHRNWMGLETRWGPMTPVEIGLMQRQPEMVAPGLNDEEWSLMISLCRVLDEDVACENNSRARQALLRKDSIVPRVLTTRGYVSTKMCFCSGGANAEVLDRDIPQVIRDIRSAAGACCSLRMPMAVKVQPLAVFRVQDGSVFVTRCKRSVWMTFYATEAWTSHRVSQEELDSSYGCIETLLSVLCGPHSAYVGRHGVLSIQEPSLNFMDCATEDG